MTELTRAEIDNRRAQLLARLGELDTRLHGIESELLSHESKDWEDMATERENDEVLASIGDEGKAEIRMIQAALARIEKGEYGACTQCGAPISAARLDLLPATPFCKHCAQ